MKVRPPVPGTAQPPGWPPVHTVGTVAWPDGASVSGEMESHRPSEEQPVRWKGSIHRLIAPPALSDACYLLAYMEHQAEITGGKLKSTQEGIWPARDEVMG